MSDLQFPDYDVAPLIPRSIMPQVDEIYIPDMLVWMGQRNIQFSAGVIDPANIKVRQEINVDKALGMPADALYRPVLISIDNLVIDGDHRWYRHLHDKTMMPYIRLGQTFSVVYDLLREYPRCYEAK